MQQSISFVIAPKDRSRVIAALTELGCVWSSPAAARQSLLDTFDGRLHKAGLRLTATQTEHTSLRLGTASRVEYCDAPAGLPRRAADLPAGAVGERIARVIGIRALLPTVAIEETATCASFARRDGSVAADVVLHEHVRIVDRVRGAQLPTVLEVQPRKGAAKAVRRLVECCEQQGLEPLAADLLMQAVDRTGANLAGYTVAATVPLDPTMHSLDGFRAVLANLLSTIEATWAGVVTDVDPEFLHSLRVATRRSRAVVNQGKAVLPPSILDVARDGLAQLGAVTGPVRDLDVYLIEWQRYTAPLGEDAIAALQPVRELLASRREAAFEEMVAALERAEPAAFLTTWGTWLRRPVRRGQRGPHAERPLAPFVLGRIERAQATLLERGRMITPSSPAAQVHELRKDAKKLRYLLECFGSMLPALPRKRFVQRLKALQDNLGAHQDAEVHVAQLRELSRALHQQGAGPDTMLAVGQLVERLDQQRVAARVEFAERFRAYDTKATQRALAAALTITR